MSLATYYRQFFWKSIEMGIVPDFYLRSKIRANLEVQLSDLKGNGNMEDQQERLSQFLAEIKAMPIAINQANANEQHYEVPSEFYLKQLGPCLKYSCGYWPNENTTLEESETIMLDMYCKRAGLANRQTILDLGCGWGSVALFVSAKYPESKVFALSNSATQREFIMEEAQERGIKNLTVFTGDVAIFQREDWYAKFDRIISIEMFEHMKNYGELMSKIANWLNPGGQLFVHIFTHKQFAYHFDKGWMAKTFFTGGTMPSHDLLLHFQEDLQLVERWVVNGQHYSKTLEAWLKKLDANIKEIWPILETTYGKDKAARWYVNWRLFYIVCSETFGYNHGNEWMVSHYLFKK